MLIFESKVKFEFKHFHSYELPFNSNNSFLLLFWIIQKMSMKFEHATGKQGYNQIKIK